MDSRLCRTVDSSTAAALSRSDAWASRAEAWARTVSCSRSLSCGGVLLPFLGGDAGGLEAKGRGAQLLQLLQPHGDLQRPKLIPKEQVLLSLLRLLPQGDHLELQFADLVADAR